MATPISIASHVVNLPARAAHLFETSLSSPALVGSGSAAIRFKKIQWCIIFWRLLALGEIVVLMVLCSGCFFSSSGALVLLGLGLAHTSIYALLLARSNWIDSWQFYLLDLLACMTLMLVAGNVSLIVTISLYASTVLISRPVVQFRQVLPPTLALCAAFIAAVALARCLLTILARQSLTMLPCSSSGAAPGSWPPRSSRARHPSNWTPIWLSND